ncbi:MAG: hypothetical protein ACFFKA_00520 [Candidatus Thorarchaeota archaeon]
MIITKFTKESSQNAIENFNNIKDAIEGLYMILRIITKEENEPFIKMGMDNIGTLYQSFLKLIFNDYGLRKLIKKIKSSELRLDIPLENLIISEGTNLLNEEKQKNCKKKQSEKI